MTHQTFRGSLNAMCLIFGMSHLTSTLLQDAVGVLHVVSDDPIGKLILANDLVSNTLRTVKTCNTCLCSAGKEENCVILPLRISSNIKTSLNKVLDSKTLSSQNKWFYLYCDTLTESTRETSITNSSPVLIVQLTQFSMLANRLIKDGDFFDFSKTVS